MQERVNTCVFESWCMYTDCQNGSYFPWLLPTATRWSFFDIYFNGDIHFQAAIQSYSSVKNVFKKILINIRNYETSDRPLSTLAKLISYDCDTISTHSEFILLKGTNDILYLPCLYPAFVSLVCGREATRRKISHTKQCTSVLFTCPHGYSYQSTSTKAIANPT